MSAMEAAPLILLVEDNADHAELTLRSLAQDATASAVWWIRDAEEALDFLYGRGRYTDGCRRPALILLDVNLPRVGGTELLRRIKADEVLRSIPVVMLSTSEQTADVRASYAAGANSFVTKPVRFTEFGDKIRSVKAYWMSTNVLPV